LIVKRVVVTRPVVEVRKVVVVNPPVIVT